MRYKSLGTITFLFLLLTVLTFQITGQTKKNQLKWKPLIPKVWDEKALSTLQIPLAEPSASPIQVSADYYYKIPIRPIYKSYPVYAPGKEPAGYIDWLKKQEPKEVFDPSKLKTKADWIKAGELVFEAPIFYGSLAVPSSEPNYLRDPDWYKATSTAIAKDGTVPFYRYIVQEKGKIEIGMLSCAMCHTKVMPDGTVIKGAQGNFPYDSIFAYDYNRSTDDITQIRAIESTLYAAPWLKPDPYGSQIEKLSKEEFAALHKKIPTGTMARHGATTLDPAKVPDLFDLKQRTYFDSTGLVQHRDIVDLMRYSALNQDGDFIARYGDFIPQEAFSGKLPEDASKYDSGRYSDEQLYALALYIYQITPPVNPNKFNSEAAKGKKIFFSQGCADCHTPPLYTNNKLIPVEGFTPPAEDLKKYNIMSAYIGTDPTSTLKTRRGTGYYKVPPLKHLWCRDVFEHNGSISSLEDWFNPKRLKDDYVPTGRKLATPKAVKGHPFGLGLSEKDRKALVYFLKTL